MSELVYRASIIAAKAHAGQTRKYTGDPYIVHPLAVARLVWTFRGCEEMQAAALLHDVIEDTDATLADLKEAFPNEGPKLAVVPDWVMDLTDQCHDGNRAARKAAECQRLAGCSAEVQTIKLCDLIDNTSSIVKHDPGFARTYLKEKRALVEALDLGWMPARQHAWRTLTAAEEGIG